MTALDPELTALLRRLETGIAETVGKWKSQGTMIVVGSIVVAGLAAIREIWFLVPICLLFGVAIYFVMNAAARNSGPENAEPVLEALRVAPGRIEKIGHRITSDSRGVFVTHWIDVIGDEGHIMVRADNDWRELIDQLAKRCPQARVTGAD